MIDERMRAYAQAVGRPLPDDLRAVLDDASAQPGMPPIHVSPQVGRLLELVVRMHRPMRVVEIGTLWGFSAAYLARGLPPGGKVITIEKDERFAALAIAYLERLGLADRVEVRVGDAAEVLETIDGAVDLVVIDADKRGYPTYLKWAHRRLAIGGVLIADDSFGFGHILDREFDDPSLRDAVLGVRTYNHVVCNSPHFVSMVLETDQGLTISVRVEAP